MSCIIDSNEYTWCEGADKAPNRGLCIGLCIFHAPQKMKGVSLAEFNKKVFEKIDDAIVSKKPCNLSGTVFDGDIGFSFKNDRKSNQLPDIDFSNATFSGAANFYWATFNSMAYFTGRTVVDEQTDKKVTFQVFESEADLSNMYIKEKLVFENVNLKEARFSGSDLKKADFVNCVWPKRYEKWRAKLQKIFPGWINHFWPQEYSRDVLYDELLIPELAPYKGIFKSIRKKKTEGTKGTIKKVEILYRRMKLKYIEEHDWPEVSNYHYGEKEMARKAGLRKRFFSLHFIYYLSSGYGERPFKALLFLFCLMLVLPMFKVWCFEDTVGYFEFLKQTPGHAFEMLYSLVHPFVPDGGEPPSSEKFFKLIYKILIPLQTAFFVLALRNRFRR